MQNEGKDTVCRLCLKLRECTFEYVEAITIEILGVVGLELDLDVSGRLVICRTCSENLQKCCDFKTMCLNTEDIITSFRNDRDDVKLDLQEIYLRKNENKGFTLSECHTVCRLCMEIAEADCYLSLNDEAKDTISAILGRCFPELDQDVTQNPVICTSCNESLYSYFNFVKSCLDMKNTILQYCEMEESDHKPQEESKSALQFSAETILKYKNDCSDVDIPTKFDEHELYNEIKLELENLTQKESHVKHEINEYEEVDYVNVEQFSNAVKKCHENEQNCETELKSENLVEAESLRFNIKREEIDIKSEDGDPTRSQGSVPSLKDAPAVYSCGICTSKVKRKGDFQRHMLIHRDASEVTMYSCEICAYKARHKSNLKQHMQIHKDSSEVRMYSCEKCTYKAKRKSSLIQHMLIHKDASEVTMHSCGICAYKAKRKSNLKQHMLIHKDASEVTKHSCGICAYKAKQKSSLRQHIMLFHRDASEVTMYSCGKCAYKAKVKGGLKRHMLIHKDAAEIRMFSCGICTYKAKYRSSLIRHMLVHKDASEVRMYSCGICTYKTKRKSTLKRHMPIHKASASDVTMHSDSHPHSTDASNICGICAYKAKHKSSLRQHMLIHRDTSEVTMYSCKICTYKAKRKSNLTQHMLVHKNASEVTMYSCGKCTFKTKRKNVLKGHMLTHKNVSRSNVDT